MSRKRVRFSVWWQSLSHTVWCLCTNRCSALNRTWHKAGRHVEYFTAPLQRTNINTLTGVNTDLQTSWAVDQTRLCMQSLTRSKTERHLHTSPSNLKACHDGVSVSSAMDLPHSPPRVSFNSSLVSSSFNLCAFWNLTENAPPKPPHTHLCNAVVCVLPLISLIFLPLSLFCHIRGGAGGMRLWVSWQAFVWFCLQSSLLVSLGAELRKNVFK